MTRGRQHSRRDSHARRGRRGAHPRHDDYVGDDEEDAVSLLGDLRDIMLAILSCSCCGICAGSGRAADGLRPDGSPNWTTCPCRVAARQVVEEFTGGEEQA